LEYLLTERTPHPFYIEKWRIMV